MKSLSQKLLAGSLGVIVLGCLAGLLVFTVEYHPPGVKPHQREAYAAKMRKVKLYNEALASPSSVDVPVAIVPEPSYDFGMVDPHATLSHEFVVMNKGGAPLRLEVAGTSCKCTLGSLKDEFLPPGAETKITLTWNTGYQADHYEQVATILTNDPLSKSIELKVEGEVRAEMVVPKRAVFDKSNLGEETEARFVVYSQLWKQFSVSDVSCDVEGFEWHAEPIPASDARLADKQAKSAWEVRVFAVSMKYGEFKGSLSVTATPGDGGDAVVRELGYLGKVRAPINFYNKQIHPTSGLDIGTLNSGKEHVFHLIVRVRGDEARKIEVLDVEPKQLAASLEPLSTQGSYRLTVTIPADCPMVMFNGNHKHGYVHVGDPNDKNFSNWFPLLGAVVAIGK